MAKRELPIALPGWFGGNAKWLVFAFAFLLYANTAFNEYNLDDELVVTTDVQFPHRLTSKGISAIPEIFREPYYKDEQGYMYDYRPIVLVTYAVEQSLFGNNIHVSHFINALLYAFLCLFLFHLLTLLFKSYSSLFPLLIALLFTAHPIHTEVVASAKNRDEILALLFALLSTYFLLKATSWCSVLHLFIALLLFALAVYSKSTIVVFTLIAPILYILRPEGKPSMAVAFTLLAAFVFAPLSMLSTTDNVLLSLIYSLVILGMYALKIYNHERFINWLKSRQAAISRPDATGGIKKPFFISNTGVLLFSGIILISVTLLYEARNNFYLLPLNCLLLLPFFTKATHNYRYSLALSICLNALFLLLYEDKRSGEVLATAYFIYSAYVVFFMGTRKDLFFLLGAGILNLVFGVEIALPLLTVVTLYCCVEKPAIGRYLKYLPLIITIIEFSYQLLSQGIRVYYVEMLQSLVHINWFILLGILFSRSLRSFAWLLLFVQLLAASALHIHDSKRKDFYSIPNTLYNTKIKIDETLPPQVIKPTDIDRPFSMIETVTDAESPLEYRMGTTAQVFRKYLQLLLIPYPMSFYYGYKVVDRQTVYAPLNLVTILFYAALLLLALFLIRNNFVLSIGLLAYLVAISIYSNILLLAPGTMADRFLFVPSVGFSIVLAYLLVKAFRLNLHATDWLQTSKGFKYVCVTILVAYSGLTIFRNTQWKNHLTLFSADIAHLANSAQANNLYAVQLVKYALQETDMKEKNEMLSLSEKHFKQALSVYPDFSNAQYDLARVQSMTGKHREAEKNYYLAAQLNPQYPNAWLSAIELAIIDGRQKDARNYCLEAAKHLDHPVIYNQFLRTYFMEAQYDSVIHLGKSAIKKFPGVADFPQNIGYVYQQTGNLDSAMVYYRKALLLSPGNPAIVNAINEISALQKNATKPD